MAHNQKQAARDRAELAKCKKCGADLVLCPDCSGDFCPKCGEHRNELYSFNHRRALAEIEAAGKMVK